MRILAIERPIPNASPAQFTPELAKAEARRVWELHQQGAIRELFFRAEEPAALLMLESADIAEARAVLASLPSVGRRSARAYFAAATQGRLAASGPGMYLETHAHMLSDSCPATVSDAPSRSYAIRKSPMILIISARAMPFHSSTGHDPRRAHSSSREKWRTA